MWVHVNPLFSDRGTSIFYKIDIKINLQKVFTLKIR